MIDMAKALAALRPAGASSVPELREIVKENRLPESEEEFKSGHCRLRPAAARKLLLGHCLGQRKRPNILAIPGFPQAAIVDPLLTVSLPPT